MKWSWILAGARNAGSKALAPAAATVVGGAILFGVITFGQKLYQYFLALQQRVENAEGTLLELQQLVQGTKESKGLNAQVKDLQAQLSSLAEVLKAQNNSIEDNEKKLKVLEGKMETLGRLVAENKPKEEITRILEELGEEVKRMKMQQQQPPVAVAENRVSTPRRPAK